jgi:DNA-binding transcriptional ArsR family regulator
MAETDKLVVLSLQDQNSKQLAKILSNETALRIMNKLAEKRHSPTELAESLGMALSTVQYNLDLLRGAGMLKETAYRYSEKGKKVSYYEPVKKVIVLAPESERSSILSALKDKFLIPIALGLTALAGLGLQPFFQTQQMSEILRVSEAAQGAEVAGGAPAVTISTLEPWIVFALGGLAMLIIMVLLGFAKTRLKR